MHLHQEMLMKPKEESAEMLLAYTKDKQQSTGDKELRDDCKHSHSMAAVHKKRVRT